MPVSYSLYEMTAFPSGGSGLVIGDANASQPSLMQGYGSLPGTQFHYQRTINDLGIDVYRALHEHIVNRTGRIEDKEFTEFIAMYRFPVFYHVAGQLLMLKISKDVARGAMRSLTRSNPPVSGESKEIDLESLRPRIQRFKGVWFDVADSANVSSQALFGPSVDGDLRFERALGEGRMKYIRFDHPFEGELHHIGLSPDCNVVLFDDTYDEQMELRLVLDVKTSLIDHAELGRL